MTTRAMGPMASIGWLRNAINLGRHNPKAIFGGAALILVLALLPSVITVPMQLTMTPGPTMLAMIMGFSILAGILLVPLIGGYLGVIDAAEQGRMAKATDVFAAYRSGGGALRLIGFALGMLVLYAIALVVVAGTAGVGVFTWYMQLLAASSQSAGDLAALQQLPDGLGLAVALGSLLGLLLSGVYAIGFGQVAIGGRSVTGALADGIVGSIKNLLPLLVLALAGLVAMLVLVLVLALVVVVLGLLAKLVGTWLMVVLLVPLYGAFLLAMYVVMFGVMYYLWRDVCGGSREGELRTEALTA